MRRLAARAQTASVIFAMLAVCAVVLFACVVAGVGKPAGAKPMGLDFVAFWAAARLALLGHSQALYDNAFIEAFERTQVEMPGRGYLAFYYPPPFLLLCLPLGLLPYLWALLVFLSGQAVLLFAALRRIVPAAWAVAPVIAFPGFLMNIFSGQNGGLTAACFAGAMIWLEERPLAAGACLGALVYKPQMAVAVPFALLPARRWRASFAAAGTAAALCLASLGFLGPGPWAGFLANAPAARGDLEHLAFKWHMMQSFYAGIRLAGGGLALGYVGQALLAGAALLLVASLAWRRAGPGPEMAALACAALLVTPFLYDYDLVVLAAALAWMASAGPSRGEAVLMSCLYMLPLVARAAGFGLGVPLAPPLILGLLLMIWRRGAAP